MSFFKMCWYDIKHGCLKNYRLIISPIIFEIIVLILFDKKINMYEKYCGDAQISLGDILFFNFGGIDKYIMNMDKAFIFPIIWMVYFVLVLVSTLSYPISNINGFGNKILVKCKQRVNWWYAKCVCNICCNILYLGLIFIIIMLFCSTNNIPFNLQINDEIQSTLFELNMNTSLNKGSILPTNALLLIALVTILVSLLQMVLSLWVKPIYSFLIICTLLLASAYFQSIVLIGNFAILLRHNWINNDGINWSIGIPLTIILIASLIIIGAIRFKKYNIINHEEN